MSIILIQKILQSWAQKVERAENSKTFAGDCECCICGADVRESDRPRICQNLECSSEYCKSCLIQHMYSTSASALYALTPVKCCQCLSSIPSHLWLESISGQSIPEDVAKSLKRQKREIPEFAEEIFVARNAANAAALLALRCGHCHGPSDVSIDDNSFAGLNGRAKEGFIRSLFDYNIGNCHEDMDDKILSVWLDYLDYKLGAEKFLETVVDCFIVSCDTEEEKAVASSSQVLHPQLRQLIHGIVVSTSDFERRVAIQVAALNRFPFTKTRCCNAPHCFRCQTKGHHIGVSCEERQRAELEVEVQFCPSCRVATIKSEGCDHIICVCGAHWEWETQPDFGTICSACRHNLMRYCPLDNGCLHHDERIQRARAVIETLPPEIQSTWIRRAVPAAAIGRPESRPESQTTRRAVAREDLESWAKTASSKSHEPWGHKGERKDSRVSSLKAAAPGGSWVRLSAEQLASTEHSPITRQLDRTEEFNSEVSRPWRSSVASATLTSASAESHLSPDRYILELTYRTPAAAATSTEMLAEDLSYDWRQVSSKGRGRNHKESDSAPIDSFRHHVVTADATGRNPLWAQQMRSAPSSSADSSTMGGSSHSSRLQPSRWQQSPLDRFNFASAAVTATPPPPPPPLALDGVGESHSWRRSSKVSSSA